MNPKEPTFDISGTKLADFYANSQPAKPVSVISTDQAKSDLSKLNVAQSADMDRIARDTSDRAAKAVTSDKVLKSYTDSVKSRGGLNPQEAKDLGIDVNNYDYDPNVNMYIPKEGITGNPAQDAINVRTKKDRDELDAAFNRNSSAMDTQSEAMIQSIKDIYAPIIDAQEALNNSTEAKIATNGIRQGSSRYAGEVADSVISAEAREGISKLEKINAKLVSAITNAQNASSKNKLALFQTYRKEVDDLRGEQNKALEAIQKEALKKKADLEKTQKAVVRDAGISKIVSEGITDPQEIFNHLNFDENGNQTGAYTLKEISDSLKAISPDNDVKGLTGSVKNFYILKGRNNLPGNITALPEDQQLFAYLKAQKASTTRNTSTGHKITLSEAKNSKLPLSTVGMTDEEVTDSLYEKQPPAWYLEKVHAETASAGASDEEISKSWEAYRQGIISGSSDNVY